MSTAQHTPGPWTFSQSDQLGDTRFYVAQADGAPYTPAFSDVATLIAETVSIERAAIQEANARLIAAAPELLAALQMLADWSDKNVADPALTGPLGYARAAIAKATGSAA